MGLFECTPVDLWACGHADAGTAEPEAVLAAAIAAAGQAGAVGGVWGPGGGVPGLGGLAGPPQGP